MSGTGGLEDRDSKAGPAPRRLLAPARPPRELRPHISLQPPGVRDAALCGDVQRARLWKGSLLQPGKHGVV